MYIIDRLEHGNGGVYGTHVLASLPLKEALNKRPQDYNISDKMFGFWPLICRNEDINNPSYYWSEERGSWVKSTPRKKLTPSKQHLALQACKEYLEEQDLTYWVRDGVRHENELYVQVCDAILR